MMKPPEEYRWFARVYEEALGRLFFDGVKPLLERLDREYPAGEKTLLDLGCGTGLALEFFGGRGYRTIGLDASYSMLRVGRSRIARAVVGDFRQFSFRTPFERVTCLYDSLNHILEVDDLVETFSSVRSVMGPESLFWFDVNHADAYETIWAMAEPYRAWGDDWTLEVKTRFDEEERIGVARVAGSCTIDGEAGTFVETHLQRSWSERVLRSSLEKSGLEAIDVIPFNPFNFGTTEVENVKEMWVARPK